MTFRLDQAIDVRIREPSDVTPLPRGDLFVVSDLERAGVLVKRDGTCARVDLGAAADGESGFEAVAYDARRKRLFIVREEHHELVVLHWAGTAASRPRRVRGGGKLPAFGRSKKKHGKRTNKGIEGMACLPAAHSPTGEAHLVLAQEAKPRALVLLDADGSGEPTEIALDKAILEACADFSGLAVDPISGHVFICSDESSTVAEVVLDGGGEPHGELVAVTRLRDRRGKRFERVEGVAIDEAGDLFVLQENERVLWRFVRAR